MPELPEVEIVKRSLLKTVNKAKIIGIKVRNKNLRYKVPFKLLSKIINKKILKISRRSKYLILHFRHALLLVHLGMTGKFLIIRKKDKHIFKTSFYYDLNILPKHNHIYFTLNNNFILIYNDVRRFGFFKIYEKKNIEEINFLKKLGPEPLSFNFNANYFNKSLKNKKKNIKNLLMDQNFVSGLGNIYVNEALFISKIHPLRSCKKIKKKEIENLLINIKKILKNSISKGGASIKDFGNIEGKKGQFQQNFHVYGKENEVCSRISCRGIIKRILISGRSSFYCCICQR
tara:strand:- start:159 stop:1022 length:864 start_codon:yes stop_codon:yes gene_type:complete